MNHAQITSAMLTFALICLVPALRIRLESGSKAAIIAVFVDGFLIGVAATKAFWP